MRRLAFFLVACWLSPAPVGAISDRPYPAPAVAQGKPEIVAELERDQVYEGESVFYRVLLNHVEDPRDPELKGFDDFLVVPAGQESLSFTQIVVVDGRRTQVVRRGRAYTYRLTPRKAGVLRVPAPAATINGQTLRGEELTLQVIAPQEQDAVRMHISVERSTVYPMQAFTVTLSIAVKELPGRFAGQNPFVARLPAPALQIPWIDDEKLPPGLKPKTEWQKWLLQWESDRGFAINDLARPGRLLSIQPPPWRVRGTDKSGKEVGYWEYKFARAFVPQKTGQFSFGPVTLKGSFATRLDPRRGLLGEDIYAVARPITVAVKDVPLEGRPDSYIGAVGRFEFAADLAPRRAKTGDPMTLTLALKGEGTLETTVAPDLAKAPEIAQNFKVYDPTEHTKGRLRQFTYGLRPLHEGIREFPPVPVAYFDVEKERYVTLRSEPIPIEITQAEQLADQDIVSAPRGRSSGELQWGVQREGICANVTDISQVCDDAVRPGVWVSGLSGVAGLYALICVAVGRAHRLSEDKSLLRRWAAPAKARCALRAAVAALATGRLREGADQVQAALLGLVADLADLPAAGLTRRDAQQRLQAWEVDQDLVRQLGTVLEHCEGVRYGAADLAGDQLGRQAEDVLAALIPALKAKRLFR
jgi:hypothetical protein